MHQPPVRVPLASGVSPQILLGLNVVVEVHWQGVPWLLLPGVPLVPPLQEALSGQKRAGEPQAKMPPLLSWPRAAWGVCTGGRAQGQGGCSGSSSRSGSGSGSNRVYGPTQRGGGW